MKWFHTGEWMNGVQAQSGHVAPAPNPFTQTVTGKVPRRTAPANFVATYITSATKAYGASRRTSWSRGLCVEVGVEVGIGGG
jgi:hypothetical protein